MNNTAIIDNKTPDNDCYTLLPAVYSSIEEAAKDLGLNWRTKLFVWEGDLCRKGDFCPIPIIKNGKPVRIENGR